MTSKVLDLRKVIAPNLVKAILSQQIRRTNLEGHNLMLKGIHPSMVIDLFATNLVINLFNAKVE